MDKSDLRDNNISIYIKEFQNQALLLQNISGIVWDSGMKRFTFGRLSCYLFKLWH